MLRTLFNKRGLSTTTSLGFKFKLTEEMSTEFEEQQKAKAAQIKEPEQAITTKESSLLMARVSHDRYNKVVKVSVPKHRMNEYYLMYIREGDDLKVYDENEISKPGDWVLIRRKKFDDPAVNHTIERVVYSYGNYVDPITGRRAFGLYYDDDMEKLEQIKLNTGE